MAEIKRNEADSPLYEAFLLLKTRDEVYHFFQDLCTVTELRAMERRFEVALLLHDGMIYNDILEKTGASSATVSRVNRSLNFGAGGYEVYFDRAGKRAAAPEEDA